MSHFSVVVIGDDVEGQLAPYDEGTEVEPYRSYWDSDDLERWDRILRDDDNERYLVEGGTLLPEGDVSLEQIAATFNTRYDDDERVLVDDGGIYSMSTYNPKSKWDWYTTGGRWRGYFKLRSFESEAERWHHAHEAALARTGDEAEAVRQADAFAKRTVFETAFVGDPGVFDNEPENDVDVVMKGDVNVEAMQIEAAAAAGRWWDEVHAVVGGEAEPAESWDSFVARVKAGELDIEQARELYGEQPRVAALKAHHDSLPHEQHLEGWGQDAVADYQLGRDVYVQRARDHAFCPFAYVKDGEWHQQGRMGWFGMSDDTEVTRADHAQRFAAMWASLPEDTILTLVDCHI